MSSTPAAIAPKPFQSIGSFRSNNPMLFSFLWALGLYLCVLTFFKTYFQFPDDSVICLLFKGLGFTASPSEYNLSENALLSLLIQRLYSHWANIHWYPFFLILTQFLSLWAVLASFHLSPVPILKSVLFTLGAAVFAVHSFADMEWTRAASFAAVGGVMLLAALWIQGDTKNLKPRLVLASVLLLLSALLRFPTLPLITLCALPAVFYFAPKGKDSAVRTAILWTLLLTALLSLGSAGFQSLYYSRNPAWADSLSYFKLLRLLDFRNLAANETTQPILNSIGWTSNDLALFKNFYYMDPKVFSAEKLQVLCRSISPFSFTKNFTDNFPGILINPYTWSLLGFFGGVFFLLKKKDQEFMALSLGWTLLVLFLCACSMKLPERVFLPCFFLQCCLATFLTTPFPKQQVEGQDLSAPIPQKNKGMGAEDNTAKPRTLAWILLTFGLIISLACMIHPYIRNRFYQQRETGLRAAMTKLDPQDDQLYVTWGDIFPYQVFGALDDYSPYEHFHLILLSWFQHSPTTQAMMDRFGLKDFSRDIVNNAHVRLICSPEQFNLYRNYMREKYQLEVVPQVLFMSDQFPVIAVRTAAGPNKKQ